MAQRDDMLALIRAGYAARDGGDVEGLVTAFHPDGAFTLMGNKSALQLTGTMQGHPTLREAFTQFAAGFGFEGREILAELVDGDRVAVHSRLTDTTRPERRSARRSWTCSDSRTGRSSS